MKHSSLNHSLLLIIFLVLGFSTSFSLNAQSDHEYSMSFKVGLHNTNKEQTGHNSGLAFTFRNRATVFSVDFTSFVDPDPVFTSENIVSEQLAITIGKSIPMLNSEKFSFIYQGGPAGFWVPGLSEATMGFNDRTFRMGVTAKANLRYSPLKWMALETNLQLVANAKRFIYVPGLSLSLGKLR